MYLWVKFSIQKVVLRVSRRKNSLCGFFFWCFWLNLYRNAIVPQTSSPPPPLPWNNSGCAPALRHYSFYKLLHLECLTVFWTSLCLDNCTVICIVTLCYVLHQRHSEFWHIQHSVLWGIWWHIQSYLVLLRHIHTYLDII